MKKDARRLFTVTLVRSDPLVLMETWVLLRSPTQMTRSQRVGAFLQPKNRVAGAEHMKAARLGGVKAAQLHFNVLAVPEPMPQTICNATVSQAVLGKMELPKFGNLPKAWILA